MVIYHNNQYIGRNQLEASKSHLCHKLKMTKKTLKTLILLITFWLNKNLSCILNYPLFFFSLHAFVFIKNRNVVSGEKG